MLEMASVRQTMRRRAQASLESNGGHFEHLLQQVYCPVMSVAKSRK